jgi:hypothetical protein
MLPSTLLGGLAEKWTSEMIATGILLFNGEQYQVD